MLEEIKKRILADLEPIPSGYRNDSVTKEIIRCVLYNYIKEQGLIPVPEYRVPRYPEGPVDIAALDKNNEICMAIGSAPTVELKLVKSMDRIDAQRKIIITFSAYEKKVKESAFFLNKTIEHLHLYGGGD